MGFLIITILSFVILVSIVVIIVMIAKSPTDKQKKEKVNNVVQKKGRTTAIRDLEKKLIHDPHNIQNLESLGELYFMENNWDKVWHIYKTLYDISSVHPQVDYAKATCRMGIAAFNLSKYDEAIQSFMLSGKREPDVFETNYYLGKALSEKGIFDKAINCFKKCRILNPDNLSVFADLGLTYFKANHFKDALPYLKKILDEDPSNKEILFDMAISLAECGIIDKALKIFMHLRPDPIYGAQACLEAGRMHEKQKDFENAISDYEIALKLPSITDSLLMQIKYRYASCCFQMNNIPKGLMILKQIASTHAGYKDVETLITRYSELNKNQNLQTYLMAGTSDFVALCRMFIQYHNKDGFVKIEDVSVAQESIEIICYVESAKWEAKTLYRFYRTQTVIGDIYIREFHSKMRDSKCDKGICVSMGTFSENCHKYIEGRPIDLIEKDELCACLKKINVFN